MDTQTQIDRLIELAIVQRTDLKKLVSELPQLREHLSAEIERTFDEFEPQLRTELEEFCATRADDKHAKLSAELGAKIESFSRALQDSAQAKFSALLKEREENVRVAKEAEAKIAEHAASLPSAVKEIVDAELSRFPRAGEIDQLRKEFQEPRGLNPRGKWQSGEVYNKLDLVAYNGDSFVSNTNGNRERPNRASEEWTLNAARGNSGGGGGIASLTDILPIPSSGQILASEGPNYTPKTLVAGANITITETPTQITITGDEGQIELQDGTAAAPSLFFVNDVDTGLFRPGTNLLGIAAGGQAAITIGATEMTLNVTDVKLGGDLSIDNDTLFIDKANSRIGIGTSTPEASLVVRSQGSTNTRSILVQHNDNTTAFSQAKFIGARSRGSHGSPSAVLANDSLVSFNGRGYKTNAWSNTVGGFYVYAAENWTNTATGSFAAFRLAATGGTTVSEVARLTSTGNLLVGGTTDISGAGGLKVFGTTSASTSLTGSLLIGNASAATNVGIGGGNINAGGTITSGGNLTAPDLILGTSGPSVRSSLGAKASRQGLVFDGTANVSFSAISPFGTSDFTVAGWVNVTSFTAARALLWGETNSFGLYVNASGKLQSSKVAVSSGTESTTALVAGKFAFVAFVRSGATGTYYVNGVSAGTTSESGIDYTVGCTKIGSVGAHFLGATGPQYPYNRALTAAEVVALYEAGTPSGADYGGTAAGTALNSSAFVQESSLNFDSFSGASTSGFTAGAASTSGTRIIQSRAAFAVKKDNTIRVTFTATQNSGTIGAIFLTLRTAAGSNISASGSPVVAGSNTYIFTATSAASDATVAFVRSNGGAVVDFTISSFTATPLGLLLAPDAQQSGGGTVWYDTSGNSANITLPASGVQWSVPTSGKIGNALAITNTTASTSTTTGSLVLSGGLGVAGALFTGGNVTVNGGTVGTAASTNLTLAGGSSGASLVLGQGANGSAVITPAGSGGAWTAINVSGAAVFRSTVSSTTGRLEVGPGYFAVATAAATDTIVFSNNGEAGRFSPTNRNLLVGGTTDITGTGGLKVFGTTASTSTTTGALQVAGGVGVAGAAFFGGAIAIGNTVNTVSPTSPDRTITMVIGGTTYYLAAKTTND
jgi:hypothetical protein